MKYTLIYMRRPHSGQPEPDLMVKIFEGENAKLDMLHCVAENHITQRGVRAYAVIEGGEVIFGGPTGLGVGDVYDAINKEVESNKVVVEEVQPVVPTPEPVVESIPEEVESVKA